MAIKIGIVLGSKKSNFAKDPHYALEIRYFTAIERAGALAVPITYNNIESQLDGLDGIILPGGDFNTPSCYYVENAENPYHDEGLWFDAYMAIGNYALLKNIPVLGICAGMQTLAILLGGKLTMGVKGHRHPKNNVLVHSVSLADNSILNDIYSKKELKVNSIHSEAVAQVSDRFSVTAISDDGIIEGIESNEHEFAVGVQWHPECLLKHEKPEHCKIFDYFIKKCDKKK